MKKVILTGFEPFGNYKNNPTQDAVEYFNGSHMLPFNIIGLIFPCAYYHPFKILSTIIDQEKPDAVISMGLSSCVKGIRVETTFHNKMYSKYRDVYGLNPNKGTKLDSSENAPQYLKATADCIGLANMLHLSDIPTEVSIDADSFVCNSLAYYTTQKILKGPPGGPRNMFIHIPWTTRYKGEVNDPSKFFLSTSDLRHAIVLLTNDI